MTQAPYHPMRKAEKSVTHEDMLRVLARHQPKSSGVSASEVQANGAGQVNGNQLPDSDGAEKPAELAEPPAALELPGRSRMNLEPDASSPSEIDNRGALSWSDPVKTGPKGFEHLSGYVRAIDAPYSVSKSPVLGKPVYSAWHTQKPVDPMERYTPMP